MPVQLVIKQVQAPAGATAAEFPIDVEPTVTVEELKEQISGRVGLPKDHIRLVCAGRIWQNTFTVGSYEPNSGAIVHCLNNAPKGTVPAVQQPLQAANPLQSMMPQMPAAANGDNSMNSMMAQAQQSMMQNPEMMQQLMSSPMVQQMLSDPETMRAMMRMNPQLNDLMERKPEIARLLEDPEVLRQSMQMIANPSLMREMTRNADRAISQLDAMPGGHSALVQAHEEFADPLFEAMAGSANNGDGSSNTMNTYTQVTEGGPNSAALPNPWGASSATPAAPTMPTPAAIPSLTPGQTPGANPMGNMMQQMQSNPAQMQQMMAMAQQMMGGGNTGMGGGNMGMGGGNMGMGFGAPAPATDAQSGTTPPVAPAMPTPAMNPFLAAMTGMQQPGAAQTPAPAANPMGTMMQQMMSNPAQMQQMMEMSQRLMGGQGAGNTGMGLFGAPAVTPGTAPATTPPNAASTPLAAMMQRNRFASQLAQLSAMGFTNESACLQALAQHDGRVDAAIDTLLSSGEGSA